MKRILSISTGILMSICLACPLVIAQTTAFTYQGSLNTGGLPANGSHDFEVALFDLVSGGTQLGTTLTRSNVTVTNGVFSLSLDFGNQFPGANRFLEIRVRPSGGPGFTTLLPRQPVNSSPYSVVSLNANQLGGIAASQYLISGTSIINAGTQFNIGGQRVLSTQGANNTFVGEGTGTTGTSNTFAGASAGLSNTTGTANSFFGAGAGQDNADGIDNSFFGVNTGRGNTSGSRNSFYGRLAGRFNSTGSDNTFAGFNAGSSNGAASFNAAFGSKAGENNTGGSNAFFGFDAGSANTTATSNSFFGRSAGNSTTDGGENSFFGRSAGNTNTSGSRNTLIGSTSDVGTTNLTNATAIGARSFVTQSNSLILGSINGVNFATADTNVGIGTTAPINRLTIGQPETPIINGRLGVFNPGSTYMTIRDTTDNVEGLFGADDSDFNHAPTLGSVIIGSMSNHKLVFRVNNRTRAWIADDGSFNVGDGQFLNTARMHVYGGIDVRHLEPGGTNQLCYVAGPVAPLAVCSSSIRYKENVLELHRALETVRQLRPVSYRWKKTGAEDIGLVAEEVAKIEPLLTTTNDRGEVEGVKYERISVVLINAIKEQQTEIESQRKQLEGQQTQIDEQKATINSLKAALCELNPGLTVCRGDKK